MSLFKRLRQKPEVIEEDTSDRVVGLVQLTLSDAERRIEISKSKVRAFLARQERDRASHEPR